MRKRLPFFFGGCSLHSHDLGHQMGRHNSEEFIASHNKPSLGNRYTAYTPKRHGMIVTRVKLKDFYEWLLNQLDQEHRNGTHAGKQTERYNRTYSGPARQAAEDVRVHSTSAPSPPSQGVKRQQRNRLGLLEANGVFRAPRREREEKGGVTGIQGTASIVP